MLIISNLKHPYHGTIESEKVSYYFIIITMK